MHLSRLLLFVATVSLMGCQLDLKLPEPPERGRIGGSVDTGGNIPPSNIEVSLVAASGGRSKQATDSDGGFLFDDLLPGNYSLSVTGLDGFAPAFEPGVEVISGQLTSVTLTPIYLKGTPSEATLTGKIVAANGGNIAGARVEFVLKSSMQKIAAATVEQDGAFTQRLPPGTYLLKASHPLYLSNNTTEVTLGDAEIKDLSATPISLGLNPSTISGRVFKEIDGQAPVAAAGVSVTLENSDTTTTDVDGRYSFTGQSGGNRTIRFSLSNYVAPTPITVAVVAGGTAMVGDVSLSLIRGVITGVIEMSDRQPTGDVAVGITGLAYSALVTPDATEPWKGKFRISQVPPGTHEVVASKARYARAVASNVVINDTIQSVDVGALVLTVLQGDFRIDDGDATNTDGYTRTPNVTLLLTGFTGAAQFRASEDSSFTNVPFVAFSGSNQAFTLASTQGTHVVYAEYKDATGTTSPRFSSSIVLDSVAPTTPTVQVNGGQTFTNNSLQLALTLDATEGLSPGIDAVAGVAKTRISLSGTKDSNGTLTAPPQSFQRDVLFPLPQPQADAVITVTVQYFDHAGNRSADATSQVVIDTKPPTGATLSIDRGADATANGFTNTPLVQVQQTVSNEPNGGFVLYKIANSTSALSSAVFQPFSTTISWFLDPTGADDKHVYVILRDAAGNLSAVQDATIVYDTTPPSPVSAALVGTSPVKASPVSLTLSATDAHGLSTSKAVTISEDPFFVSATITQATLSSPVNVPISGDGPHQILVRFQDKAGNTSSIAVPVVLDSVAPTGQMTVGDGQPIQSGSSFAVTFTGTSSDVNRMLIAVDTTPSCATLGGYVTYAASTNQSLSDGTHTVRGCLADTAGNFVATGPISIIVDTQLPTMSALSFSGLSNAVASITNRAALTVVLSGVGDGASGSGVDQLRISTDPTFAGVPFGLAQSTGAVVTGTVNVPFTLPSGDGPRTIYAQVKDRAGLISAASSANVTLDTQAPVWTSAPTPAKAFSNTTPVSVSFTATDNIDLTSSLQVGFSATASCGSVSYQAYGSGTLPVGPLAVGLNTYYACIVDRAGNAISYPTPVRVTYDTTAPVAASITPNPPVALASGALISWVDLNADTDRVEVETSKSPTFSSGVLVNTSAVGNCATNQRPQSFARVGLSTGDAPLDNLTNWYFRLRAFDCAGNPSGYVAVPGTAVPNLTTMLIAKTTVSTGAAMLSDGPDVWLRTPQNTTTARQDLLMRCRPATQDCRDETNWVSAVIPIDSAAASAAAFNNSVRPPGAMVATNDTLYLFDVLTDTVQGNTSLPTKLVMAWCDRNTNCDLRENWSSNLFIREMSNLTAMATPVAGASGSALGVFYVLTQPAFSFANYLSMARCDRAQGTKCRQPAAWVHVDTPIRVNAQDGLTVDAADEHFYIGAVSEGAYGATIDTGGEPVFINCERGCIASSAPAAGCTGNNCGCDGYRCGDFRFSRFDSPPVGWSIRSTPPQIVSTVGDTFASWSKRECNGTCADTVRAAQCLGSSCLYGSDFVRSTILSVPTPGSGSGAPPRLVLASSGGPQGPSSTIRIAFSDVSGPSLKLFSCAPRAGGCFAAANGTMTTLATGPGTEESLVGTTVGRNLFVLGRTQTVQPVMYEPILATPYDFFSAPQATGVLASWQPLAASGGSTFTYRPAAALADTQVSLADPFISSFAVPATSGLVTSRLTSVTGVGSAITGIGDSTVTWSARAFSQYASARTDVGAPMAVSISAPGHTDTNVYATYITGTGTLAIGRCNTTTDCSVAGNWSWGQVTSSGSAWNSVQLSIDFSRPLPFGAANRNTPNGTTPRLFIAGLRNTNELWVAGCVLTSPSACAAPGDFTLFRLDSAVPPAVVTNAQVTIRAVGDFVEITEPSSNTGQIVVRFCDGARSGQPNVCVGPGTTDKALNHCFSAANWKAVTLDGSSYGAINSPQVVGTPAPTHGYTAVQSRDAQNGGFIFWSCARGQFIGGCSSGVVDCSVAANWRAVVVETGSAAARYLDVTLSEGGYSPTALQNDYSVGIYVSYLDLGTSQWGVAQCRGGADFQFFTQWHCTQSTNGTRTWGSAPIVNGHNVRAVGSTIRVVNGDLVASFFEDDRILLASCARAVNCSRREGWHAYVAASGIKTDHSGGALPPTSWGYFTSTSAGDIAMIYPNQVGATRTLNFLTGGSFQALQ